MEFSKHSGTKSGYQSICKKCNLRLANKRARKIALKRKIEQGKDPVLDFREKKSDMDYIENVESMDIKDIPDDAAIGDL